MQLGLVHSRRPLLQRLLPGRCIKRHPRLLRTCLGALEVLRGLGQGASARTLSIGEDVRPGDLLAVRYTGARQFQHVGAFYSDGNSNGLLDADDLVLHAGPEALHLSRLGKGAFDGEVAILRPERSRPQGR